MVRNSDFKKKSIDYTFRLFQEVAIREQTFSKNLFNKEIICPNHFLYFNLYELNNEFFLVLKSVI